MKRYSATAKDNIEPDPKKKGPAGGALVLWYASGALLTGERALERWARRHRHAKNTSHTRDANATNATHGRAAGDMSRDERQVID